MDLQIILRGELKTINQNIQAFRQEMEDSS